MDFLLCFVSLEITIFELEMKRGKVPLPSVDSYYMMDKDLGYLKINRFSQTTFDEFDLALDELISQGMEKMILDLRDNPGGYLHPAIQISNALLQKDQTIVILMPCSRSEPAPYSLGRCFASAHRVRHEFRYSYTDMH